MPNTRAFLDTLSKSEGTYGKGDNGYNVLFGGKLFTSYADHPRIKTYETHDEFIRDGKLQYTTAAGKYQITVKNYDAYKGPLKLKDFSPASQDAIALQLIKERGALPLIEAGEFDAAVVKCAPVWASLPGGCGDQHENKLADLRKYFVKFGGTLAA